MRVKIRSGKVMTKISRPKNKNIQKNSIERIIKSAKKPFVSYTYYETKRTFKNIIKK